jgi:hypothetical protein
MWTVHLLIWRETLGRETLFTAYVVDVDAEIENTEVVYFNEE